MLDRRSFLKTVAATGAAVAFTPHEAFSSFARTTTTGFGIHPFIDAHPDAVFIMKTSVDVKTNAAAIKEAALSFGRSVFLARDVADGGIPMSTKIAVKPNLTCRGTWDTRYTVARSMGIQTDVNFTEGVIESMKELGLPGSQFYIREVNCPEDFIDGGYVAMAARTGADLRDLSAQVGVLPEEYIQWKDVPQGVWFVRIPYLWPVNAPDSWLVNIAKFKTHSMGLTLCAKNIQGTLAANYQQHCTVYSSNMNIDAVDVHADAKAVILQNYNRHSSVIPRWDRPGSNGGLWMETWASRCLDNNSVTHAGLNIIEGIYGHDGNFIDGPGADGIATDHMSNVIIFGRNQFSVDIIGHYLGGHEPGNFGLFHLARERGMVTELNPRAIPVYEWKSDATATLTPLENFPRTALLGNYLRRDYNGGTEAAWHLVNEQYDYGTSDVADRSPVTPEVLVLAQNFPNPFNASTIFQFTIPRAGNVRLQVHNALGEEIQVVAEGWHAAGAHMAVWRAGALASGVYFYSLWYEGHTVTRRMLLIK
jgi:uncharacterized protein (DUF362 family)